MNQWEKSPYISDNESPRNSIDTKASRSSRISEGPIVPKDNKALRQSEDFYQKTLSESRKLGLFGADNFEDEEEEEDMEILKRSLGNVLQDLSDKERLTDDEYQEKVSLLCILRSRSLHLTTPLLSFPFLSQLDVQAARDLEECSCQHLKSTQVSHPPPPSHLALLSSILRLSPLN
jgi:hypothetical protein